jgi:hypothetical protein
VRRQRQEGRAAGTCTLLLLHVCWAGQGLSCVEEWRDGKWVMQSTVGRPWLQLAGSGPGLLVRVGGVRLRAHTHTHQQRLIGG